MHDGIMQKYWATTSKILASQYVNKSSDGGSAAARKLALTRATVYQTPFEAAQHGYNMNLEVMGVNVPQN